MATDSELESLSSGLTRSISVESNGEEPVPDFSDQISQLHEMVQEMRDGFTSAMQALAKIQYGDQVLKETVDSNKALYEQQLADVVQMVLALKTEFGGMVNQLEVASENQKSLHRQVQSLQFERDILLEELETDGAISSDTRAKYHSGRLRPNGLNKSSDSTTLTVLLERARTAFHSPHKGGSPHNSSHFTSDHDSGVNTCQPGDVSSCEGVTPPLVSPRVQSYISGLDEGTDRVEDLPLDEHYESDSSVTAIANRSLDLSRSLGDKCSDLMPGLNSSDEEDKQRVTETVEEKIVPESVQDVQCSPENESPAGKSPSLPGTPSPPRPVAPHERNARENQRSRIAREVLDTEKKYCSSLWTVIDHFAVPLKRTNLLSTKEVATMFPQCLWRIYGHHCLFLQKLENRLANWKWQCVLGDIFAQFVDEAQSDLLTQYQLYVNDFPYCLHQIRKSYRQSSRFKKFLKACHRHPCCEGLDIGAFLLTPIQRVPRYVLLLKNLLKYTDLEHPDYYYIEHCLQKLNAFLADLNDSMEDSMQAVAEEGTPKPKRRALRARLPHSYMETRGPSMASSQAGVAPTDISGRVASPAMINMENVHDKSSVSGRISPGDSLASSSVLSPPRYGASTLPARFRNRNPERAFSFGAEQVPPGGRQPLKQHRSRSAMDHVDVPHIVYPEDDLDSRRRLESRHRAHYRPQQRPFSMLEGLSKNDSFRSQLSSEYGCQHSQWTSQESLNTPMNSAYREGAARWRGPESSREHIKEYRKTLSSAPVRTDSCRSYASTGDGSLVHQSMPRLNQDFGIFGDNDQDEGDNSAYQPSLATRCVPQIQVTPSRSKSQGDGLHRKPHDVTQQQINMALAHSLTGEQAAERFPRKASTPYTNPQTRIHPAAQQTIHPAPQHRPVRLKDNLWVEPADMADRSTADLTLNESTVTIDRFKVGRKKKGRQKKTDSVSLMDMTSADGDRKKKSFSFKSIFFRKRKHESLQRPPSPISGDGESGERADEGSKVAEIIQDDQPTPANRPVDPATAMSPALQMPRDVKEQAAPTDATVEVEVVQVNHVELESYEDENGDPCSAV